MNSAEALKDGQAISRQIHNCKNRKGGKNNRLIYDNHNAKD